MSVCTVYVGVRVRAHRTNLINGFEPVTSADNNYFNCYTLISHLFLASVCFFLDSLHCLLGIIIVELNIKKRCSTSGVKGEVLALR